MYEIRSLLGVGGMGEVYRALDTRLKREVAIKVLLPEMAHDPDRLARFEREAQILAQLNHPNIAVIYGVEPVDDVTALVLEYVDGPTLADRIATGPVPIDEALAIAKQIAEALEAAHEQGIIHRDLKPANIKVRADGTVKVLDFGLAKALEPAAGTGRSARASMSPTLTSPAMTQAGMILGTAAYMAPEQARGKTVDKRADIWAFGAVLFEMLTGRRAFGGEDVAETLANVINQEPGWEQLPATVPAHVRQALRLCLRKAPRERVPDIGAVRLVLDGAFETAAPPRTAASESPRGRGAWKAAFAAALLVAVGLTVPALRHVREMPPPPPPETRTEVSTPTTDSPASFALSPDGRQIVFVASGDGAASRLWLRPLGATTAQPLAGTDGATRPFWSPDSRSVGFFAGGALKRLDLGGAPRTLAPANNGRGGTWNAEGVIVFAPSATESLMRVSATGGAVTAVTAVTMPGPQELRHSLPFFLPDGRRFLFTSVGAPRGIYLGALDGSAPTRLAPDSSQAVYLPAGPANTSGGSGPRSAEAVGGGGWLLWVRATTLVAQRLDLERETLTGNPVTVADDVASVSVAATGLVAYRTGRSSRRQLVWVDPSGAARGSVGDPEGSLMSPRVSVDGRRVVVVRTAQENTDLWLLDSARTSRLTFDVGNDDFPVWSPDGRQVAFRSSAELHQTRADGAGVVERLVASGQTKVPFSWSADGRFLFYASYDPATSADLWVLRMTGDRTPSVILKTPFRETQPMISPDGRWLAYLSDESGRNEVYVRRFVPSSPAASVDTSGGRWPVSTAGGIYPTWRPDGKALYYLNPAGEMMAAPIVVEGETVEPSTPVVLFQAHIVGGGVDTQQGRQYDVAPDGRFLINTELSGEVAPITLIQHWNPEARP